MKINQRKRKTDRAKHRRARATSRAKVHRALGEKLAEIVFTAPRRPSFMSLYLKRVGSDNTDPTA